LDDLTDKAGIRVITRYHRAVDSVVALLRTEFHVTEDVMHGADALATFGYTSHHLLVRLHSKRAELAEYSQYRDFTAEIQVRSILQHAWATISHSLDYKSSVDIPQPVRRRLFRVAALLETGDEIFDTFVEEVAKLRSEYREAAPDTWRSLALNLDAAEAVWEHFPWQDVASVGESAGWLPIDAWKYTLPLDDFDRSALSRLISTAQDAGFTNWGQLADLAEHVSEFTAHLKAEVEPEGGGLSAVGPHVLTFILLYPDQAARARKLAGIPEPGVGITEALREDRQDRGAESL
jgi:hypothetical protein